MRDSVGAVCNSGMGIFCLMNLIFFLGGCLSFFCGQLFIHM